MAIDLLGVQLSAFLTCALQLLTEPVGRAFLAPGQEVAWDDCCEGQLWIRVISVTPAGETGARTGYSTSQHCGVVLWNALLGVGVVRCASTVDDNGVAPPAENLTLEALQMSQDRADLEAAIYCCWTRQAGVRGVRYLRWEPLGPQGGCVGGEWQVSCTFDVCACEA